MAQDKAPTIEDLMQELGEEKLQQEPPKTVLLPEEEPTDKEVEEVFSPLSDTTEEEKEEETKTNSEINLADMQGLPGLIVSLMNFLAVRLAAAYTKTDNKDKYALDDEESQRLIEAWEVYLKNTEYKASPSSMLLMTTAIIFTPKIIMAVNERKEIKQKRLQCQE
ncbi:MAG: hypothetical protein U0L93_05890 [Bacteroidales bacterium]|nr:hypothetical protein [Bacteroidales bacterium]